MCSKYITIKDYKLIKNIGKGAFGEVYLTMKNNCSTVLATKRVDLRLENNQRNKKYLDFEISIMKQLDHPNIIHLIEFIQTANHYYVIMEYCNGGSLLKCLERYGKPFPLKIIQYFMRKIVEGLIYIHSYRIIHRDIKLDNILLNFKNKEDKLNNNLLKSEIKIIDFGLAIKLGPDELADTFLGSPYHMDPRILGQFDTEGGPGKRQKYNEKADIWSLGTICYQMYTGRQLFDVNNLNELMERAKSGNYSIPINIELYYEIISFLNSMLQYKEENRLNAKELSKHAFLTKDISEFTKVDLALISGKIKDNAIGMNFLKNNSTVLMMNNNNINFKNISNDIYYVKNNNIKPLLRFTAEKKNINNNNVKTKTIKNQNTKIVKENEIENLEKIKEMLININQIEKKKEIQIKQKLLQLDNEIKKVNLNNLTKNIYIYALLFEYEEAKDYFKENNLIKQEQDAYNKYLEIQKIKTKSEQGNIINNIPKPINPEYIYGYSTLERNNKFKEILNYYISKKNKIESQSQIKGNSKQNLEENKIIIQKLDFIIKEIEKKYNNIWVRAPEYEEELKQSKKYKTFFDKCDFNIKIKLKKLDNNYENILFFFNLKINKIKNISKEINFNSQNKLYEEWIWNLKYNEWRNIDINDDENFFLETKVYKNVLNQTILKKEIQFEIDKIINGKIFSYNILIPSTNNVKIEFNITITPIFSKGYIFPVNEVKKDIILTSIFPSFIGKTPFTNNNRICNDFKI